MNKPKLFLTNPTGAVGDVRGILQRHVRSLANYVAESRIDRADKHSGSLLNSENFLYKVLVPAAALFAGQEYLLTFMQDAGTLQTMKGLVAEQGYVSGIVDYVSEHAFRHSSVLRNVQDITVAGLVASLVAKVAIYGFDRSVMKLPDVANEAFKQIALDIYNRYSELVLQDPTSELAAFKQAFKESEQTIDSLDLDAEQKRRLLSIISNKLTPTVTFHKQLGSQVLSR